MVKEKETELKGVNHSKMKDSNAYTNRGNRLIQTQFKNWTYYLVVNTLPKPSVWDALSSASSWANIKKGNIWERKRWVGNIKSQWIHFCLSYVSFQFGPNTTGTLEHS